MIFACYVLHHMQFHMITEFLSQQVLIVLFSIDVKEISRGGASGRAEAISC